MNKSQWKRLDVLKRLQSGALKIPEAAQVLGLSARQVKRLRKRFADAGSDVVQHGNKGRRPSNRCSEAMRRRIVGLYRGRYAGFNDQHFTEKLVDEGIETSRATVRRCLRAAGIASVRTHRKAQAGLMMLWDGSRHDWLEGRGPMLCLVGAIDDATGELLPGAHFVEQECAAAYLGVLLAVARDKGLPCSAYMDQHGALRRNDKYWTLEEELRGQQDLTQVGRALEALGIEAIYALSPQAKGRVERLWGTLQDRLTSELRLCGSWTREQANSVLALHRSAHNRRFTVAARDTASAWRPVRGMDLERACSFHYEATVLNDNTVRIAGQIIDVPPGPAGRSYARTRVEVRQVLNGSWRVYAKDQLIATAASTELGELRAQHQRKRSAASRAFRKAVHAVAVSLP